MEKLKEFYKDSEIFFTGGSGVVGKAGIEKLLRSTDVKKIYILLRPKKSDNAEQRLEKIKSEKIFRVLKTQKPDALDKLVAIPGDTGLPKLGITPFYAKKLENVSCIFHCAATVRFNEVLVDAIKLNVGGTWEALKLAESLKNLKIFVHVSTFYSNPYLEYVESKVYTPPMNWKICLKMIENANNAELMDVFTKKMIVGFGNTYCFSKCLAESVVDNYLSRIPVVVFRPAIVFSAMYEPEPGFPSSLMSTLGLIASAGAGLLKVFYCENDWVPDTVPQDYAAKTMIVSAFVAAQKYEKNAVISTPVTPCSSYGYLDFSFKKMNSMVTKANFYYEFALNKGILIPGYFCTSCRYLYKVMCFTHHILPALMFDVLLRLFGKRPAIMSIARKQYLMLEVLKPFTFNNYKGDMSKVVSELHDVSRGTDFDIACYLETAVSEEAVTSYWGDIISNIREILLNEDPSTIPRARRILNVKIGVYYVFLGCFLYYILSVLWSYF